MLGRVELICVSFFRISMRNLEPVRNPEPVCSANEGEGFKEKRKRAGKREMTPNYQAQHLSVFDPGC